MTPFNFAESRKKMVKDQLEARKISDPRVLKAMGEVPREAFVPPKYQAHVYDDGPLPIGGGQTISQPYMVALMTELLELKGKEKVLEVGTGSGYQAAVLAKLAGKVYSLERRKTLLKKAQEAFIKLGLKNIQVKAGDGSKGWPSKAPFEGIIVTAAAEKEPKELLGQLKDGGKMVLPLGSSYYQRLIRYTRKGKRFKRKDFGGCVFVPLIEGR